MEYFSKCGNTFVNLVIIYWKCDLIKIWRFVYVCVGGGVPKELRTSQRKKLLNFGEIRDLIDLKFNFFHAMTNSGSNKHE